MTEPSTSSALPEPPNGSIFKHMLRGSLWAVGQNFSIRLIGLFNTIILARLLAPDDFGLVTMAAMVLGFLNSFVDLGHSALLLRQPVATREHCDTAWTFSILRGLVVGVFLAAISPWVAEYFREDRVIAITVVLAVNGLIANGFSVGLNLLRKELNFAADFYFNLANRVMVLIVTLALALWWRSYWAIVIGTVIGNVFGLFYSFKVHPYRPRLSLAKAREYLTFSLVMIPLNVAFYFTQRVDAFVVGRLNTAAVLGVYNVAAELATMLTIDLMQQISRGLYPNFATLLDDRPKLNAAYLGAVSAMTTISVAFGLGLWAVSEDFVRVVLGEKWTDAIPLLGWLAIGGTLRGIDYAIGTTILTVTGFERTSALLMWVRLAIYVVAAIAGAMWGGTYGVAISMTIGAAFMIPVVIFFVMARLQLRSRDFVQVLWRPMPAGLAMIIAVRALHLDSLAYPVLRLFIDTAIGGIVFVLTLFAMWYLAGCPNGIESRMVGGLFPKLRRS